MGHRMSPAGRGAAETSIRSFRNLRASVPPHAAQIMRTFCALRSRGYPALWGAADSRWLLRRSMDWVS